MKDVSNFIATCFAGMLILGCLFAQLPLLRLKHDNEIFCYEAGLEHDPYTYLMFEIILVMGMFVGYFLLKQFTKQS